VALVGAWLQLRLTRKTTLETRAHEYLERYSAPGLIDYRVKAHLLIGKETHPGQWALLIEVWELMSFREKQEVLVVMNFWEELAGMYNRDLVDKKIIREYFGDVIRDFWKRSAWLRDHAQSQYPGDNVYNELDLMCKDLSKEDLALRGRTIPRTPL